MGVEIPLFSLATVLFPHMLLPLHIFEERYRVMMRDCEESGTTFGVVAIREGVEARGPATPHSVGTLAMLREVEKLDDGRYNLLCVGASRFRVVRTSSARPYLTGDVEYLADEPAATAGARQLAASVAQAFRGYAEKIAELSDRPGGELELPDDPELLSYLVSATLQIGVAGKQELLEMNSATLRLRRCLALLRRESVLLEQMLAHRDVPVGPISLN